MSESTSDIGKLTPTILRRDNNVATCCRLGIYRGCRRGILPLENRRSAERGGRDARAQQEKRQEMSKRHVALRKLRSGRRRL
jgi:hypothetical protein